MARTTAIQSTTDGHATHLPMAPDLPLLPPSLGRQRRYQSDLDEYYRAARLAIEGSHADDVIYVGFANHVFASVLSRVFKRAYLADLNGTLASTEPLGDPTRTTLCILHIDLHTFMSTFLYGGSEGFMLAMTCRGTSLLMIVEAPDWQGGLDGVDRVEWRSWFDMLHQRARCADMECRISPTIVGFFHGHPGFIIELVPAAQRPDRPSKARHPAQRPSNEPSNDARLQSVKP